VSQAVIQLLRQKFGAAIVETHAQFGDDTAVVESSKWLEIATFLKNDPACAFEMLSDLSAVDYPERTPRLEVVAHLYSLTKGHRVRIKTRVGDEEGEGAEIDTVVGLWGTANWLERECFDMFGVNFRGHPDLRRILMYPEFQGHPLRKDYPAEKAQPLVAYRTDEEAGMSIDKQAPFGPHEGMSFARNDWTKRAEDAN
jgi:NADH-quinone oxidoreductase subunit C